MTFNMQKTEKRLCFFVELVRVPLSPNKDAESSSSCVQVHGLYRRTGASFHKAQQEFSQGVFTSKTFQTAASSAAQGALQRNN